MEWTGFASANSCGERSRNADSIDPGRAPHIPLESLTENFRIAKPDLVSGLLDTLNGVIQTDGGSLNPSIQNIFAETYAHFFSESSA